jgi:hypothetical protein
MITRTIRPYSEQEKQQLLARLPSRWARAESFIGQLTFLMFLLLLPVLLIDKYFPISPTAQTAIIILLLAVAIGTRRYLARKYGSVSGRSQVLAAIAAGQAEVLHVITSRAVERADPEDFGTAYYLEVQVAGEPRLLYLQGQHFDELEEGLFPNTEFNLVRTLATKELLDLELVGQPFLPERVLPAFAMADWQRGLTPEDGAILIARLDELT